MQYKRLVLADNTSAEGVGIVNSNGDQLSTFDVYIQDQTSDIVDYYITRQIRALTLVTAIIDTRTVTVTDATGVIVGNYLCLQSGVRAFQARILAINGNVLTIDSPLDFTFPVDSVAAETSPDMNVDGSVTPVIFELKPGAGVQWDVTRILIVILDEVAMDDGKFGGITALTNGCVLRKADTVHHKIFNIKTNGAMAQRMYDVQYADKAPAGQYGLRARRSFAGQDKNGVVIRLDGDNEESLQMIIQDNLTGLLSFRVIAQGHVVETPPGY